MSNFENVAPAEEYDEEYDDYYDDDEEYDEYHDDYYDDEEYDDELEDETFGFIGDDIPSDNDLVSDIRKLVSPSTNLGHLTPGSDSEASYALAREFNSAVVELYLDYSFDGRVAEFLDNILFEIFDEFELDGKLPEDYKENLGLWTSNLVNVLFEDSLNAQTLHKDERFLATLNKLRDYVSE